MIRNLLTPDTSNWLATPPPHFQGPFIALIHGLLAGKHMENHLLKFLRTHDYHHTSLFSNHQTIPTIARHCIQAHKNNQPIVLIGYSQGGFQVNKLAQYLNKKHIPVTLMLTIAAGGIGRTYLPQWGYDLRKIPRNVKRCLNYYSAFDKLGTDLIDTHNLAMAISKTTYIENIRYAFHECIDHLSIARCYPATKVPALVQTQCLDRLLSELSKLHISREQESC